MENDLNVKQCIVVRKDLNMRKGKLAAQVAHASGKILLDNIDLVSNPKGVMKKWFGSGFTKIVVGCDSEEELLNIYKKAQEENIFCSLIMDAGRTEFKEPTYTCVALGPEYSEYINKITGELKLL